MEYPYSTVSRDSSRLKEKHGRTPAASPPAAIPLKTGSRRLVWVILQTQRNEFKSLRTSFGLHSLFE